jgi:paraquat-inducible protein B
MSSDGPDGIPDRSRNRIPDGIPEDIPEAADRSTTSFSLVWLIPIVAVVIGGWIAFQAISQRGPTITIAFKSAEGIEAGKTKVAYKDLQIGSVTSLVLAEDLSHVVATAELVPGIEEYLTENTRFWVVRPQVSAGRITGLGTLLSGAFIAIDPVLEGEPRDHFVGLETPPVVTTSEEGSIFTLHSRNLGSFDVGAPVYYRQIPVGEVAAYEMAPNGDHIDIQVFVRAPHDERVRSNTRFWNASGLDVSVGAEGLRIETDSVVSMLIGGIAFDNHDPDDPGTVVEPDHVFQLYKNRRESEQPIYTVKRRYLLHFDSSVQGLVPGSPVVFRGIQIGRVLEVQLELDPTNYLVRVPVVIELEPERLRITDFSPAGTLGRVERLVANGMRAQLGRTSLITGGLQVELDLHEDAEPATLILGGRYPELPTIPAPLEEITASVSGVLAKIDRMPLEKIGADLQGSMAELREMLSRVNDMASDFDNETLPALNSTLSSVDETVSNLDGLLSEDAPLPNELRKALEDVGEAARSVRVLADYLEQHPEALILGK